MNKPDFIKYHGIINSQKYINFIERDNIIFKQNFNYGRKDYFGSCENFFLVERFNITNNNLFKNFLTISNDLFQLLNDRFGNGTIYNIQFSLMHPNSKIKEHYDYGLEFTLSNRIHLPLISNNQVLFFIENKSFNLTPNKLIEINNKKSHSVINNSDRECRIHLILDYLPLKYAKYLQL